VTLHLARLFDRALAVIACALIVALLATVTAGIVSRGFNQPFVWTDELAGFLMVWLACFGWMVAARRRAHIRIRFFQDKLPYQPKRWTEITIQCGTALLGVVVAIKSIHLIQANADVDAIAMPVSTAWMYAPVLPAGLLCAGQAVADILAALRGGRIELGSEVL
jgi:TRAP-type transport system small permease protein